ncbi:MAG: exopolysaccharide biosynthesis polyprenyl glycosylphosphotransferase [Clostridia bacterium]|nr:exopolysaccharide biosynthesis polyprenyl glycosylphosphotransferase [Clostridia bacterium]
MESPRFSAHTHALVTALIGYASFLAAYIIRFYVLSGVMNYGFFSYNLMALLFAVLHYAVFSLGFYHRNDLRRRFGRHVTGTIFCESVCLAGLLSALYVLRMPEFSRMCVLIASALSLILNCVKHSIVLKTSAAYYKSGANRRAVLLIGEGATAERYAGVVSDKPEYGHRLLGHLASCAQPLSCDYLGDYAAIDSVLASASPDEAVIALPAEQYVHINAIIASCERSGVPLRIIPCYEEHVGGQIMTEKFEDIQMVGIRDIPLNRMHNAALKRAMDIAISLTALILLSPLMLFIAIGVRLSTKDSVFFTQTRVGKDKKPFKMLKFRSMRKNDGEQSAWSTQTDDRRTFFGALIRKTSLDELPQIINVLRGEMSIVGPRPEIPHFVEQFKDEIPLYMIRHAVKPGMTGLAQVRGLRGDTSIDDRIRKDIEYIENWTIWMDIRIILRTIPAVVNDEHLPLRKKKKK